MNATKFTANETRVLLAMFRSMRDSTGFDFGFLDEARAEAVASGMSKKTFDGTRRELRKKVDLSYDEEFGQIYTDAEALREAMGYGDSKYADRKGAEAEADYFPKFLSYIAKKGA